MDHVDQRAAAAPGSPPGAGDQQDGRDQREQYLALLLARFESGALDAYEYGRRVMALEAAPSAEAMAAVVHAPPPSEPVLDAVDLALLARRVQASSKKDPRTRYLWIGLVAVFFVVLLAVGMWLVNHARALQNSGNLGVAPAAAAPAPHAGRR